MTEPDDRFAKVSDSALNDLIERMRAATDTSKAPYQLPELLAEQHRRQRVGSFPTVATAQAVLRLSRESEDGFTTYKAIWDVFRPGEPFKGNASANEVTNALSRIGFYCIRHGLPQIATLVVNQGKRELTVDARNNLYNAAKERGVDVGPDRDAFIEEHQRLSREVAIAQLPEE